MLYVLILLLFGHTYPTNCTFLNILYVRFISPTTVATR